ncbi:sugar phosphate isomerase/epimerase family protein [Anaerotalea alkaliphila]|uniref:TIM barrel protein n=1 Tax=Anaerotalea alkaliphila TaxID=2662126 RepID=A0A7X5HUZ8_9FIRM|nr:TIM barrel protein [Anaerotalea alkaliphila]NDL66941.1 TIM barrel protein [Anaerotalea alkaliphila]
MKESMYKYFDLGIVHFMAFPKTMSGEGEILPSVDRILEDPYFTAIELTRINDPEVRKLVGKHMRTAHVRGGFGSQPITLMGGLNVNHLQEEERLKAVEALKGGIDQAEEMGIKGFAFLSGKYEEESKEDSYTQLLKSTRALCDHAKPKGIRIILEIFDYDIAKKSLIGPTMLAKRFAEDMKKTHDNFGLMVDLSHIPMYYESYEHAIQPILEHVVHIHLGNTVISDPSHDAYGDEHPVFGYPNSENDVEEVTRFLQVLFASGFFDKEEKPIVSFEVKPAADQTSELAIANCKRVLNIAWANLEIEGGKG